jgi:peptide/nickel transport system ATP-binding protein
MALLEVRDLRTTFRTDDGPLTAVDGVSFEVDRGRTLGIVGESGCGKSVTSLTIMGLLPQSARVEGEVVFDGKPLVGMNDEQLRRIRGNDMAMIFQDPMTSLNPVYTIGWQLQEAVLVHGDSSQKQAEARAKEVLSQVGIPNPGERLNSYPHEFSGGMRQRVMIAMALINNPKLLIADEPTTALDVTIQAQILELIRRLRTDFDSAVIMITHDLGVVAELCDEVVVMYAGKVAERAGVIDLFDRPQHPYTWGLMSSLPGRHTASQRLTTIPGSPPSLLRPPRGCRFNPRCPYVMNVCKADPPPPLAEVQERDHLVACHLDDAKRREIGAEIAAGKTRESAA